MIRQIWKVRNTAGDQPESSPTATKETTPAKLALKNDESQRKMTINPNSGEIASAAKEDTHSQGGSNATKPSEKQSVLLVDVATDASLSYCTYDPHSGTVYALVEPKAAGDRTSPD